MNNIFVSLLLEKMKANHKKSSLFGLLIELKKFYVAEILKQGLIERTLRSFLYFNTIPDQTAPKSECEFQWLKVSWNSIYYKSW